MTIVEAMTGNTGAALAFITDVKGYKFVACTPFKVAIDSREGIMLASIAGLPSERTCWPVNRSPLNRERENGL